MTINDVFKTVKNIDVNKDNPTYWGKFTAWQWKCWLTACVEKIQMSKTITNKDYWLTQMSRCRDYALNAITDGWVKSE